MVNPSEINRIKQYLGRGISFPIRMNQQGNIQFSSGTQNIQESILLILLTEIGERLYRPNFGCRIHELAFAPLNTETLMLMRIYVQEALELWEPRIIVEEVTSKPYNRMGKVDINIEYRIKGSYDRTSMVYPFFLKQEQEPNQISNS